VKMIDIAIFGSGGHARTLADVVGGLDDLRLAMFVEPSSYFQDVLHQREALGVPIISEQEFFKSSVRSVVIGVGQLKESSTRRRIYSECSIAGLSLPVIHARTASVSRSARIGDGAQILHSVFVGPEVTLGRAVVLNNNSQVEHGSTVGDFCHISTGVIINGDVRIGDNVFIGSGSIVREGASIASGTFVPMGSVVKKSL